MERMFRMYFGAVHQINLSVLSIVRTVLSDGQKTAFEYSILGNEALKKKMEKACLKKTIRSHFINNAALNVPAGQRLREALLTVSTGEKVEPASVTRHAVCCHWAAWA